MPIRFQCANCQQRLSVSSRKAGARAKCPKCQQTLTVPSAEEAERQLAAAAATAVAAPGQPRETDPWADFAVFDDDVEWVYEQETAPAIRGAGPRTSTHPGRSSLPDRVDPEKVAVPRSLLYMQGILLGVVGLVCFTLGVLVGGSTVGEPSAENQPPQPCLVAGKVTYKASGGGLLPDAGAVIVVLPQDAKPEQKAPIEGLIPAAPFPVPTDPGLQSIQSIGGEYTRADVNGEFRLRVPDRGKYHVLVLSRNARRRPSEELRRSDLAQLGDFFMPAPDLLGQNRYRWQPQSIRRDTTLDVVFE